MTVRLFFSFAIAGLFLTPATSFAQSLSQLDFDALYADSEETASNVSTEQKTEKVSNAADAPRARAQLRAPEARTEQPVVAAKSVAETIEALQAEKEAIVQRATKRPAPRAKLKRVTWPAGIVGFLTPSLNGVRHDKRIVNHITSRNTWAFKRHCGSPRTEADLLSKSRAIREILFRYAGSEEFAETQCNAPCAEKGYKHQLTGVSFQELPDDITFKFFAKDDVCQYQFAKAPKGKWQVLQPSHVSCACLPAD